jgi:hypothetical protein
MMNGEPYIRKAIVKLRFGNRSVDYEKLLTAPNKSPDVPITRKHIKIAIGGLISALSYVMGYPITAPQIRALYNAIATDSAPEELKAITLEDVDLLEQRDDAFYMAIKRSRRFWLKAAQPNK